MSKRFLKSACHSAHKLLSNADDLSFKTRANYESNLKLMMKQLHESGTQISNVRHLKSKHVENLLSRWQSDGLSSGTIKNRMSMLRYASQKINKPTLLPEKNVELDIADRSYQGKVSKAIHSIDLTRVNDQYIKYSLLLQKHFGLRREESMKIIPSMADKQSHLELKPSWTKGNVGRSILITTTEQRALLDEIYRFVKKGQSLIPSQKSYIQQENTYVAVTRSAGLKNLHGLRHAYAQRRYKILVDQFTDGKGWECPYQGGKPRSRLNAYERAIDEKTRLIISDELGHSRKSITNIYLG